MSIKLFKSSPHFFDDPLLSIMSTSSLTSILLPKIKPFDVAEKYLEGYYEKIDLSRIVKGYQRTDMKFTSNKTIYGNRVSEDRLVLCNWCSTKKIRTSSAWKFLINNKIYRDKDLESYEGYMYFCSAQCELGLLSLIHGQDPNYYSVIKRNAMNEFKRLYPNAILKPANPYWWQKSHGGPLKDFEYRKFQYVTTPNVVVLDSVQEYQIMGELPDK